MTFVHHRKRNNSNNVRVPTRCLYVPNNNPASTAPFPNTANNDKEKEKEKEPKPKKQKLNLSVLNEEDSSTASNSITTITNATSTTATTATSTTLSFTHSYHSVLKDVKIYRPLPDSSPPAQSDFETVALAYPSLASLHSQSASSSNTSIPSPPQELFPLCEPTRADEYIPLYDLKSTVLVIVKWCLDDTERVPFGDEVSGVMRAIIRACNRKDSVGLRE
ncbi:UNVERIFIED_CONTAM: hypothetical protein HDU68_003243, partial [Siphonaria sp. JEL0065]